MLLWRLRLAITNTPPRQQGEETGHGEELPDHEGQNFGQFS